MAIHIFLFILWDQFTYGDLAFRVYRDLATLEGRRVLLMESWRGRQDRDIETQRSGAFGRSGCCEDGGRGL